MKKFKIYSEEVVYRTYEIEAETEDDAVDIWADDHAACIKETSSGESLMDSWSEKTTTNEVL